MVSSDSREFTIFADPLVALYENPKEWVLVKKKDGGRRKNKSYYPGEIYGLLRVRVHEKKRFYQLDLYMGEQYKTIKIDAEINQPLDIIDKHTYFFPDDELDAFVKCIRLMSDQQDIFGKTKRGSYVFRPGVNTFL